MKSTILVLFTLFIGHISIAQVSYMQYRKVPASQEEKFVELETKYWAKVAKAAIDKGQMVSWTLWRKLGVTEEDAPNYVFVNTFESIEQATSDTHPFVDNLDVLGVDPSAVETNSFTSVTFDYWVQMEEVIPGEYTYALVNYAKPNEFDDFIRENREIWMPIHESNIQNGINGMKSWGMASVIYPQGNLDRFSCFTWDGFNTLSDVMHYLRYDASWEDGGPLANAISKSRMDEIMIDGFEYRIIYERIMTVD